MSGPFRCVKAAARRLAPGIPHGHGTLGRRTYTSLPGAMGSKGRRGIAEPMRRYRASQQDAGGERNFKRVGQRPGWRLRRLVRDSCPQA
jgi:hypothetical protein